MKSINVKSPVWPLSILLLFAFSIHSCKRENLSSSSPASAELIALAKQFYEKETTSFEIRNRQILSSDRIDAPANKTAIELNPLWDRASVETTPQGKRLLTVPIPDFSLATKKNSYARKVVFNTSGERITEGQIIEVFGSPTDIDSNGDDLLRKAADGTLAKFTGAVMTYNLSYIFKEGRYYENGRPRPGVAKIAKSKTIAKGLISLPGSSNINAGKAKLSAIAGSISAITPEFEGQDCENYYLVYIERDEFGNVVYWENRGFLYAICKNSNPNSPNPGGANTDVYVDCNRNVNGNAYEDECGDCVGGNTGLQPCPPVAEIKLDSLKKYFPCMAKLIIAKLENDTLYAKLIQPFQSVYTPGIGSINFRGLPQLTYTFSAQAWGGAGTNYMLGETLYANNSYNSTVYFNSSAIANASELMLQVATIHETGHAYVHYYIKNGQYNIAPPVGEGLPWAMGIVNYGALLDGQMAMGNFVDHSILLNNYFEQMVRILKSVNGNAYSDNEYRMAALYGMNNAGSRPTDPIWSNFNGVDLYNIQKNQLQKTYNDILTKYGISAAQLNTFYQGHISNTPASKKLPLTCP